MKNVMTWIALAYTVAWAIVATQAPDLWTVALLGFIQNIAFTFVSRGRNSGSLGYHLFASIFSNGIYAALLFVSIDQVAQAKANPGLFLAVYTLATMSGSIFAHWLALRIEKGKAKTVQEDRFANLLDRMSKLEQTAARNAQVTEILYEGELEDGRRYRIWVDPSQVMDFDVRKELKSLFPSNNPVSGYSSLGVATRIVESRNVSAVQIGTGETSTVMYNDWP